jgi:hypothetical protein
MSRHLPEQKSIETILARLRTRQRMRNVASSAVRGALAGGIAAVMTSVAAIVAGAEWTTSALWTSPAAIPVGLLVGAVVGALLRIDTLEIARALDRAAGSEDRFASAVDLAQHHRAARVRLVLDDALERVSGTSESAALPLRAPRELKWLPAPVVALALLLIFAPQPGTAAQDLPVPELSPEDWAALHDDLRQELDELDKPESDEERALAEELEKLAELLKENPEKKDALAAIARLRDQIENQRKNLGSPDVSMRQAAAAMQSSQALAKFAALLSMGDYQAAAQELEKLAEELKNSETQLSAEDFEAMADDFERLTAELSQSDQLAADARQCAGAASRMNRQELSDALKRLSESMKRNADKMRQSDKLCRSQSMLDRLQKKLSCKNQGECKKCGNGKCNGDGNCSGAFVKRSDKKGGLKAGWGTAPQWTGGKLSDQAETRMPELDDARESSGQQNVFSVVSPDEKARSAQDAKELYADMVRKAEADLMLETAPPAYREYLKRYFVSIRPADSAPADADAGE